MANCYTGKIGKWENDKWEKWDNKAMKKKQWKNCE